MPGFRRGLLLLALVLVIVWQAEPLLAQRAVGATLTVLTGRAAILRADGTPISPAASGTLIGVGDQIATLDRASALVTFFDGSEIELGAETTIVVDQMASNGTQTEITLTSVFGSAVHRVVTFTDPGSTYRVQAGGTVALVRGTYFGHFNDPATGDITVAVSQGLVDFPAPGQTLRPGQRRTSTSRGDVQTDNFGASTSLFAAISQPVSGSNPTGSDNPGQTTGSREVSEQPERSGAESNESKPPPVAGRRLTSDAPAGSTRLEVSSTDDIAIGDTIVINPGESNEETARVTGFGSLLVTPLRFNHATGEPIEKAAPTTGTVTPTPTPTPSQTPISGATPTITLTPTITPTVDPAATHTLTPTVDPAATVTATPTSATGSAAIRVNSGADTDARDTALTLREAILIATGALPRSSLTAAEQAQVTGGPGSAAVADVITFDPAVTTVTLTAALPALSTGSDAIRGSGPVTIVGGPGFNCLTIQSNNNLIQGLRIRGCATGLQIASGTGNFVGGASAAFRNVFGGNTVAGIAIQGSNNTVAGNFIGTDLTGNVADANGAGITLDGPGTTNLIGGTTVTSANVISGNTGDGIKITSSSNQVSNNGIGLRVDRTGALPNGGNGVSISGGATNQIGIGGFGNTISGNGANGILVAGAGATGNSISANLIGTNDSATGPLPNTQFGISVQAGANNTNVGSTNTNSRNIISGNGQSGIQISQATGVTVHGNYIGVNESASGPIANGAHGIEVTGAGTVRIGGPVANAGNVISGNTTDGINIVNGSNNAIVQGNTIGLRQDLSGAVANGRHGIVVDASTNAEIGSTVAVARNVIAGNGQHGVVIQNGATGAFVHGNAIGVVTLGLTVGNGDHGVHVSNSANVVIGGANASERNNIGYNQRGIVVAGTGSTGTIIKNNSIGAIDGGTDNVPNGRGIEITTGPSNVTIGGTGPNDANVIVGNTGAGIVFVQTSGNRVVGNIIGRAGQGNGQQGIQLTVAGLASVTQNNVIGGLGAGEANQIRFNGSDGIQVDNAQTTGTLIQGNQIEGNVGLGINLVNNANNNVDDPVLTDPTGVAPQHTLQANVASNGTVDVYLADANGQGRQHIASQVGGPGNVFIDLNATVTTGDRVVATFTEANNTSEFSTVVANVP